MAYQKITAHVYLIHLDRPLAGHARHYLGYTALESVQDRLTRHRRGDGARLLHAANLQGISYQIVRTWTCSTIKEARDLEKRLKARKNASHLCPLCQGQSSGPKNSSTQILPPGGPLPDCNPNIS